MSFIGRFRVESVDEEVEQPSLRVGDALGVGLEVDGRNGGAVRVGNVKTTVHVRGSEHEVLADDEVRVRSGADGFAGWSFDGHRSRIRGFGVVFVSGAVVALDPE